MVNTGNLYVEPVACGVVRWARASRGKERSRKNGVLFPPQRIGLGQSIRVEVLQSRRVVEEAPGCGHVVNGQWWFQGRLLVLLLCMGGWDGNKTEANSECKRGLAAVYVLWLLQDAGERSVSKRLWLTANMNVG